MTLSPVAASSSPWYAANPQPMTLWHNQQPQTQSTRTITRTVERNNAGASDRSARSSNGGSTVALNTAFPQLASSEEPEQQQPVTNVTNNNMNVWPMIIGLIAAIVPTVLNFIGMSQANRRLSDITENSLERASSDTPSRRSSNASDEDDDEDSAVDRSLQGMRRQSLDPDNRLSRMDETDDSQEEDDQAEADEETTSEGLQGSDRSGTFALDGAVVTGPDDEQYALSAQAGYWKLIESEGPLPFYLSGHFKDFENASNGTTSRRLNRVGLDLARAEGGAALYWDATGVPQLWNEETKEYEALEIPEGQTSVTVAWQNGNGKKISLTYTREGEDKGSLRVEHPDYDVTIEDQGDYMDLEGTFNRVLNGTSGAIADSFAEDTQTYSNNTNVHTGSHQQDVYTHFEDAGYWLTNAWNTTTTTETTDDENA